MGLRGGSSLILSLSLSWHHYFTVSCDPRLTEACTQVSAIGVMLTLVGVSCSCESYGLTLSCAMLGHEFMQPHFSFFFCFLLCPLSLVCLLFAGPVEPGSWGFLGCIHLAFWPASFSP